ncbi:MAG: CPXCG motif-containing cysteine-rich protein [Gammaproteobacteria bacterium]|nr:MAG: CPXCG motif-containing cysteine-rich protein [Gammaproteobacteria bacterium]
MSHNQLAEIDIQCPYCWQSIGVLIDCSVGSQEYIEDCRVCCRPIVFDVIVDDDGYPTVSVNSDES